jgi:hypothetical protein
VLDRLDVGVYERIDQRGRVGLRAVVAARSLTVVLAAATKIFAALGPGLRPTGEAFVDGRIAPARIGFTAGLEPRTRGFGSVRRPQPGAAQLDVPTQ